MEREKLLLFEIAISRRREWLDSTVVQMVYLGRRLVMFPQNWTRWIVGMFFHLCERWAHRGIFHHYIVVLFVGNFFLLLVRGGLIGFFIIWRL